MVLFSTKVLIVNIDIEKFDENISFSLWQNLTPIVFTQYGLRKPLLSKERKPEDMSDNMCREIDGMLFFNSDKHHKLELFYMKISLVNRLGLR